MQTIYLILIIGYTDNSMLSHKMLEFELPWFVATPPPRDWKDSSSSVVESSHCLFGETAISVGHINDS